MMIDIFLEDNNIIEVYVDNVIINNWDNKDHLVKYNLNEYNII